MSSSSAAADRAETERLLRYFESIGAIRVDVDVLQPAGTLLDLYGEDIRARAFVTTDPVRGELMLRPDFTVPVAEMQIKRAAGPARVTYAGLVFRKQAPQSSRAREFLQVGCEIFGESCRSVADAEVFALMHEAVASLRLNAVAGDLGVLLSAVDSLSTTQARKAALKRHIWRPFKFKSLIDAYSGKGGGDAERVQRLDPSAAERLIDSAGPMIGIRSRSEILERIEAIADETRAPPLVPMEVEALSQILSVRGCAHSALDQLRVIQRKLPGIELSIDGFEDRLKALKSHGLDPSRISFEASYGRTTLEYYDGFVFGFVPESGDEAPPVVSGGRYDYLTRQLSGEDSFPAVGGVVRPEAAVSLMGLT